MSAAWGELMFSPDGVLATIPTCGTHELDSATVHYLIHEPLDIQLGGTCYLDGHEVCSYSSDDTSCGE